MALSPSVMWSFKSILTTWAFWRKPCRQTFKEAAYAKVQKPHQAVRIRKACVHPKTEAREASGDGPQHSLVAANAGNGVQIGEIQGVCPEVIHQPGGQT